MKPVKDGFLYLLRSITGYFLFYQLWKMQIYITGIHPLIFLIGVVIALELLGWIGTGLMKKVLDYDPLFMYKIPILAYALYRMFVEMIFLIFLFILFGFHPLFVVVVGLLYFFHVLRHSVRLNRMMFERPKEQ